MTTALSDAGWRSCGEEQRLGSGSGSGSACSGFAALWLSMTSALYTAEDQ